MSMGASGLPASAGAEAAERARRKAYRRLLPLVFISYVIAFVEDRKSVV